MCTETSNFFVVTDRLYTYDGSRVIPDVDHTKTCDYESGFCEIPNEVLVWNPGLIGEICPYRLKDHYTAKQSGNYFIIDEIQGAFRTTNGTDRLCYGISQPYFEAHGVIIVPRDPQPYKQFNKITKRSDPVNAKLNYL